jgi:hypothetical protein
MKIALYRSLAVSLSFALALVTVLPAAQAQSGAPLDKHARRMEKRLAKYRAGTFLQVELRDSSETIGSLGALSDASFNFTSSDSNRTVAIAYGDVENVKRGTEYIGEGSESGRHLRFLVPALISVAAAGAAFAIVEAVR